MQAMLVLAMTMILFPSCSTWFKDNGPESKSDQTSTSLTSESTIVSAKSELSAQSQISPKSNYKFYPIWVQNTLFKKNETFRKVNRFAPLYNSKDKLIIAANSIEGLVAYSFNQNTDLKSETELSSRNVAWIKPIPFGIEAQGLLSKGQLFVGALDGRFYSINATNGKMNWSFDTGSEIVAEPTINNDIIYVLNGANQLFSLDALTGKQNWVYNRQEISSTMTVRGGGKPFFSNGVLYVGFSDGSIVAVSASTGTPQWEVLLNKNTRFKDIDSSPVVSQDQLYINSYDDHLYSLNKSNGTVNWKIKSGGVSTPLIVGDRLYFSTSESAVVSVNKSTGAEIWRIKNLNGIASDLSTTLGLLIFGESQGKLKAVDLLTGLLVAEFDPGRGLLTKTTMIENSKNNFDFFFTSNEGNMYQVRLFAQRAGLLPFIK